MGMNCWQRWWLTLVCLLTGLGLWASPIAADGNSRVLTEEMYSPHLQDFWTYNVYLPPSYDRNKSERYPLLLLLHGMYGNERSLVDQVKSQPILDQLSQEIGQEAIVVFVRGYDSFYMNQPQGYQMESALMEDLLPKIMQDYRIDERVTRHGIGGYSMGGYGAARLTLRYPNVFQKTFLISPAVWDDQVENSQIGKNFRLLTQNVLKFNKIRYEQYLPTVDLDKDPLHRAVFYVESGDKDPVIPIRDVENYVLALKRSGYDVTYREEAKAKHNWTYWRQAFPRAYRWFLERLKADQDSVLTQGLEEK